MKQPKHTKPRITPRRLLVLSIVLLGVALGAAFAVGFPGKSNADEQIATTTVESGSLTVSVSGSGTVEAELSLDMPFETSGQVETVLVSEGDEVEDGQTLATLETRELELALADAEANLLSAQAQLEEVWPGGSSSATEQDMDDARANGNVATSDIVVARASIESAQAQLNQQSINTQADIAAAESRLREAQATLDDLLDGPEPDELSTAQRTYNQALIQYNSAQTSLEETRNRLSREKTQAHQFMEQATLDVQTAQSDYSAAYWRYQSVANDDVVPATTDMEVRNPNTLTDYGELTEAETFKQAELKLQNAEASLESSRVAYDNARQAEITGVQQAEQDVENALAILEDAQVQLEVTQAGATNTELTQAREAVNQAHIELNRLRSVSGAESVQSEASLTQAVAQLEEVQTSTETDLRIKQVAVVQAENDLERARINLEEAELAAPFAGVVTFVDVTPGSVVGESSTVFTLIDRDPLHVDLTLNENDVTQVAVGQQVTLSIGELPDWEAEGTVTYVAPVAEEDTDVVTYLVRVSFPDTDERVKVGMTADLEIVTASADNVLLVPNTALISPGDLQQMPSVGQQTNDQQMSADARQMPSGDRQIVLVMEPGAETPRPVTVETGLTDGSFTEITVGLEKGATIVAQPAAQGGGQQSESNGPGFLSGPPSGGRPGGGGPPR